MLDKLFDMLDKQMINWNIGFKYIIFILFLAIGVFLLVKFCDIFVDGASNIARKMKISPLIIGLTVVAMGTSCPELAVSVSDSISCLVNGGNANVAIGNVVGSNICNILIVLGFSVIFTPIVVKKSICKREFPFMLVISIILLIFVLFFGVTGSKYAINRIEGIILITLSIVYILFLVYNAKKHPEDVVEDKTVEQTNNKSLLLSIILTIVGAVGIILGGEFVVYGAKSAVLSAAPSSHRDLAESLVGLTIVAVGTSLPELVTSIVAAKKGENELALGNVIGSNIFNVVFVLGISATVNPLTIGSQIIVDLIVMVSASVLLFILSLRGKLEKKHGILMISLYFIYVMYLILRTVL